MNTPLPRQLTIQLRDRLVQSRFLTVSLTLHLILLLVLATIVVVKPLPEPPDITSAGPLVQPGEPPVPRPETPVVTDFTQPKPQDITPSAPAASGMAQILTSFNGQRETTAFVPPGVPRGPAPAGATDPIMVPRVPTASGLSPQDRAAIGDFVGDWRTNSPSSSNPTFAFTAYIGRYSGNWNSTVRVSKDEITAGSLPNLLYVTSKWTKDRIKTNERNVKAIPLDSPELFITKPPFIFLTGTRDFKLTEAEVENLRNYVRVGGAIWGDGSVPGQRSAFDIAFRREMEKVVGGQERFQPIDEKHPVLAEGYFPKVRELPPGINHYRESIQVLRKNGEIAVIYTSNDYGDMWQIGLDKEGNFDLSRNASGQFVAMNPALWENRGIYVRNIGQPEVEQAYKFGINMIVHLLTRWDSHVRNSAPL